MGDAGLTYTQVVAGQFHSLLLRSDGTVAVCGQNEYGQCDIPVLNAGLTYTQVAAGGTHSLLLRSDGAAAVGGQNEHGQMRHPSSRCKPDIHTNCCRSVPFIAAPKRWHSCGTWAMRHPSSRFRPDIHTSCCRRCPFIVAPKRWCS